MSTGRLLVDAGACVDPAHRAARRYYLHNFTPDDPAWEAAARTGLRTTLDSALAALTRW